MECESACVREARIHTPRALLQQLHGTQADRGAPQAALLLPLPLLWSRSFGVSVNFLAGVKQVMVENSGGGMGAGSFQSRWSGNASVTLTLGKVRIMIPVENPLPFLPHVACSCQLSACPLP